MGVLVTATQSQDACGTDWPGCNGRLFPDITDYKQVIEYTHRLVVGLLGFILLINAIFAWIKKYPGERAVSILSPLSLFLLFLQVLVGGFNVMLGTPPGFTTLDVAVSLALFSSLVFLTTALMRRGTEEKKSPEPIGGERGSKLFGPALTLLLLFYAETILGAFFKHSAAADVYMGITPHQQLIQSPYWAHFLFFTHWIFAFVVLIFLLRLLFRSWRMKKEKNAVLFLTLVVLLEMGMGFITVFTRLSAFSVSLHMILASAGIGLSSYIVGKSLFGDDYSILQPERGSVYGTVHGR